MKVKFMWNGIKVDGILFKGSYSMSAYNVEKGRPEGTVTFYMKGYEHLPQIEGLTVENETDIMTDYFETDTVRILPGTKYHTEAAEAYKAQEIHLVKRLIKRYEQQAEKNKGTRWETYYRNEIERQQARLDKLAA